MSPLRLRDLSGIPDYKPGKAAPASSRGPAPFKLSSNENPYPPLRSVTEALNGSAALVNRYPETAASDLTRELCTRFAVEPAQLVLGSGSVEIVSQLIRATAGEGDEVVFAWRSFEAYPMLTLAAGAVPVRVPLTADHRHDLDAMLAAITERTRLVLVCNPNNPTGTVVTRDELDRFLGQVPPDVTVVIDEAYVQFNRHADSPQGIDYFRRHPNVAVAHTFSKAYGLAGLRVGYALAPVQLAAAMRKVALPFGVTALAQAAAVASLRAEDELAERVEHLVRERTRVTRALAEQGWRLPRTEANFLWFPLGGHTMAAAAEFETHGLLVRPFAGEGFRVTIAEVEANDAVIKAARSVRDAGLYD
ncbi:histidinol-phosphate transaminase [Streptomyces fuscichromogenes]|uniref:Aromatic amino acid aminotransferase n=1 Tax=Streptomyces fuscichromogenes TaxID=1324013 RepID=A0A917X9A2_9ACTN|nr:histidinol-phosphate transaminase [Streptomyces fuscichromogenes]GGM97219.1 putative phenylalanine aminotransferase [Streptomyces fuscichromogenes]